MQHQQTAQAVFVSSLAFIMTASIVAPAPGQIAQDGDVTITAESTENAPCDDCPDGTGTKISYEVTRVDASISETDDEAEDFHIEVGDANADNFKCFEIEMKTDKGWESQGEWTGEHASQQEGDRLVHYISWYKPEHITEQWFECGEIYRFSVVYCGPTSELDNTFDFILTTDGTNTPNPADAEGNRSDVPDVTRGTKQDPKQVDDPAWKGQKKKAEGSKVGWVTFRVNGEPFFAGQPATVFVEGATPGQMQFLVYSLRGPGATWVEQLGVELSLVNPKLAKKALADSYGWAYFDLFIPQNTAGRLVWLQVAEQGRISNVIEQLIM